MLLLTTLEQNLFFNEYSFLKAESNFDLANVI